MFSIPVLLSKVGTMGPLSMGLYPCFLMSEVWALIMYRVSGFRV